MIARGRAQLESFIDAHITVLLEPHIEAYVANAIDESRLSIFKEEAYATAEREFEAKRQMLYESEALLEEVVEEEALVNSLAQQLEEATSARDKMMQQLSVSLEAISNM